MVFEIEAVVVRNTADIRKNIRMKLARPGMQKFMRKRELVIVRYIVEPQYNEHLGMKSVCFVIVKPIG